MALTPEQQRRLAELEAKESGTPSDIISEPLTPEQQTEQESAEEFNKRTIAQRHQEKVWYDTDKLRNEAIKKGDWGKVEMYGNYLRLNRPKGMFGTEEDWQTYLQQAGGFVGGMFQGTPGAPRADVKGAGLSALGGAAGEAIFQIGQAVTGSENAPQTSLEAAERMGVAAGIQAGQEYGGRKIMGAISPGLKLPAADRTTIAAMKARGITPTPAQQLGRLEKFGFLENIASGSLVGGKRVRLYKNTNEQLLNQWGKDLTTSLDAMPPSEAGKAIQTLLQDKFAANRALESQLHDAVLEEAGGDVLVSTRPIKEMAERALQSIQPTTTATGATVISRGKFSTQQAYDNFVSGLSKEQLEEYNKVVPLIPALTEQKVITILSQIKDLPDQVEFSALKNRRTALGDLIFNKKTQDMFGSNEKRNLTEVYRSWMKAYENPEFGLSPEAITALKKANAFSSTFHENFEKDVIKKIYDLAPSKVARTVVAQHGVEGLADLRTAVGPEAIDNIRSAWTRDLFRKGFDKEKNIYSSRLLTNQLERTDPEVLEKFVSKDQLSDIKGFIDALKMQEYSPKRAGGHIFIQMKQSGAIIQLVGAGSLLSGQGPQFKGRTELAAGLILGPAALAYLMTNKTAIRAMTNGIMAKTPVRESTRALLRIMATEGYRAATKQDQQEEAETQQPAPPSVKELSGFGGRGF